MELSDFVNVSPPVAGISALRSYVEEKDLTAPIDVYRKGVRDILIFGSDELLKANDFIGRLLLIGLVSAAEGYIRAVLSGCIEICPVAQSGAALKTINLGGLLWHGKKGFSRSAFEHSSFASRDDLVKACRDYIGFKLDDSTFKTLLDEYDVVCQFRHGIAHSDGLLPGKNAVQLGMPRFTKPVGIVIRYRHLQEVAAVINTLVYTINRELFSEMCKRWAIDWRARADWRPDKEQSSFAQIWAIFHSKDETRLRRNRTKITKQECFRKARATFGL